MRTVITLVEKELPHILYERNGVQREIVTEHHTLLNYIESSTKEFNEGKKLQPVFVSPSLPTNTVKYGQKSDMSHMVFMTFEESSHDIKYHTDRMEQVPYPKMVFAFNVKGEDMISTYVMCYKDKFLRDDSKLYRFPYSNVWAETGSLCYWNREKVTDLVQLQTFPYTWINTPNNDHIYTTGCNMSDKPLREVFEKSQHKSFDYSLLIDKQMTFNDWSSKLLK